MCECNNDCCTKGCNKENILMVIAAFAVGLALGLILAPVKKGFKLNATFFSNNFSSNKGNASKNSSEKTITEN